MFLKFIHTKQPTIFRTQTTLKSAEYNYQTVLSQAFFSPLFNRFVIEA